MLRGVITACVTNVRNAKARLGSRNRLAIGIVAVLLFGIGVSVVDAALASRLDPHATASKALCGSSGSYPDQDEALVCTLALSGSYYGQLAYTIGAINPGCSDEMSYMNNALSNGDIMEWTGWNNAGWVAWWDNGIIGMHYDVMADAGYAAHEGSHGVTNSIDETIPESKQIDCRYMYGPSPSAVGVK